jgi:hypothetical protein
MGNNHTAIQPNTVNKRSYTNLVFKCCIKNLNYFLLSWGKKYKHSNSYGSILWRLVSEKETDFIRHLNAKLVLTPI